MKVDIKGLLQRLNPACTRALEGASGMCVNRGHYEVTVEHLLLHLCDSSHGDIALLFKQCDVEAEPLATELQRRIESLRGGNPGKPVFAETMLQWLEDGWLLASLELGEGAIRSAALLLALVDNPVRYGLHDMQALEALDAGKLRAAFGKVATGSDERGTPAGTAGQPGTSGTALQKFTNNFTAQAREGKLDPVFGRDREIRQMIDILARRRKNNPIAVGEPGVGKTAVVEGLALKLVAGDVPALLQDVELLGLDLGLLQAGASVKGEFENRLNAVINEIKASEKPIILFIDEAHTLIGAGGSAGTGDAANLLKPALARGELRTIAATTWSEYKKYFEKDPALARRFQLVKLDEPDVATSVVVLRGLRDHYEAAHGVYIRDDAIQAAATLSARYVSGRQLPDKAVDLLDTAGARVKISLHAKPEALDDLERRAATARREQAALLRDQDSGLLVDAEHLAELAASIEQLDKDSKTLTASWEKEREAVTAMLAARQQLAADPKNKQLAKVLEDANQQLEKAQNGQGMIAHEVGPDVVARVVSDWTGVPLGNMVRDEVASLLDFNTRMKTWVRGQDHAIDIIDSVVRTAKAGLQNPEQPLGVFLLAGPSGVGKTETALGVANLLFGGDRFMTTINMSEFQEKHTVSRLIGSPPGYVGYGEGGKLTEAVRQRPYSVVLLDEIEKADLEVMNLFYQVFDKGNLSDGEGRLIDFRNTVIFMTSNLASATIMQACADGKRPELEALIEAIRPELQAHLKPALLARMTLVPYYPIQGSALHDIVRIKLDKVVRRMKDNQRLEMEYDAAVVEHIAARCTDPESGARNVDHIVNGSLLPRISSEILARMNSEAAPAVRLSLTVADGVIVPSFTEAA